MKIWIKTGIAIILIAMGAAQVLSQGNKSEKDNPQEQKSFTFSVKVGLVMLPVTVLDKSGEFISGLDEKAFTVYEDNAPQSLEVFDNKDVPVALGLMIDSSSSMAPMREEVLAAALALAESSNPKDEICVAHFFNRVAFTLRLDEAALARNLNVMRKAVLDIPGSGKTALYDAVCDGLEHLKISPLQKKVLVIISDGADNASKHTLNETVEMAKASSSLVYSIGIFNDRNKERKPEVLGQLAAISGGKAYFPNMASELPDVCRRIAIDVRSQYTIGYMPSNQNLDSKFRKIRVDVNSSKHDKLSVRTRSGYSITK